MLRKLRANFPSNVIAECAVQNACRLIDICRMEPYESFDGLHPNAKGMRQISDAVLAAWEKG